jgi:predicted kinase
MFGAAVVDLDVIKTSALESGVPWQQAGMTAYETIYALAADNLAAVDVIVDAPSYYPELPERLRAIADAAGAAHVFVECVCSDLETVDQRLRARTRLRSQMPSVDGSPDDAEAHLGPDRPPLRVHDRVTHRPDDGLIVVDTSLDIPLRDLADDVRNRIEHALRASG